MPLVNGMWLPSADSELLRPDSRPTVDRGTLSIGGIRPDFSRWNPETDPWTWIPSQPNPSGNLAPLAPLAPVQGRSQVVPPAENPFSTVSNVKNPDLQSAISAIISEVRRIPTNPQQNVGTVQTSVKSPAISSAATDALNRERARIADTATSYKDFVKQSLDAAEKSREALGPELDTFRRIQDTGPGGVRAEADRMADAEYSDTIRKALQLSGNAIRRAKLSQLTGDPYSEAALADASSRIGADAASSRSARLADNFWRTLAMRTSTAGKPSQLIYDIVNRAVAPIQLGESLGGNQLSRLAGLENIDLGNTLYNYETPQSRLSSILPLLAAASGLDLSNNFYGLRNQYEPDNSGGFDMPIPPVSGGGGGGYGRGLRFAGGRLTQPNRSPKENLPNLPTQIGPGSSVSGSRPGSASINYPSQQSMQRATDLYYQQTGLSPFDANGKPEATFSGQAWRNALSLAQQEEDVWSSLGVDNGYALPGVTAPDGTYPPESAGAIQLLQQLFGGGGDYGLEHEGF